MVVRYPSSFNSRTLGRVRLPDGLQRLDLDNGFNSRTLGRVRQAAQRSLAVSALFQFTHPGKSATLSCPRLRHCVLGFNSRTLGRVRPRLRSGCGSVSVFQFTHPGKSATWQVTSGLCVYGKVSIHAPWEECDLLPSSMLSPDTSFQFTHPGKSATHRDGDGYDWL